MPGPYTDALLGYLRLVARAGAPALGGIGIYALVCSALHPHPDAALMAIMFLVGATGLMLVAEGAKC